MPGHKKYTELKCTGKHIMIESPVGSASTTGRDAGFSTAGFVASGDAVCSLKLAVSW